MSRWDRVKKIKTEKSLDYEYMDQIKNTTFNPVFILGLHRSGTTILYKMLSETGQFNVFTLYHVLNFDRLLYDHVKNIEEKEKNKINNLLKEKGITNRKTDNVEVSADYEHEYVYIFSQRNYPWKINEESKELFETLCKKIKYISGNDKPILLKNPYDYPNFLYIKKTYPNAKFVFIQRNPLEVISSNMRLWKTRLKAKDEFASMYSKEYDGIYKNPLLIFASRVYFTFKFPPGIFEVIWRAKNGTKYYLKNIKYLSKDDYISLRYEDLCERPTEIIKNILNFLDLKSDKDFRGYIKPRKLNLTPEVRFLKKFIFKRMKAYFNYFGYKV